MTIADSLYAMTHRRGSIQKWIDGHGFATVFAACLAFWIAVGVALALAL